MTTARLSQPQSYAELFQGNTQFGIVIGVAGTFVQWANSTVGDESGSPYASGSAANDEITIGNLGAGAYWVSFSSSCEATVANPIRAAIFRNGVLQTDLQDQIDQTVANLEFNMASAGILILNDTDTIDLRYTIVGATGTVNVRNINLSVHRIGGAVSGPDAVGIEVKDEGISIGAGKTILDFVGAAVTASGSGPEVTVTISGGGGPGADTYRWNVNGKPQVDTDVDGAWIAPRDGTITRVTLHRRAVGSSGSTTVDIHLNGTTIFTTQANRPSVLFSAGANAIDAVTNMNVTAVSQDDRLTMDVDTVEGGNPQDIAVILEIEYT